MKYDNIFIVGAGLFGVVMAERLASIGQRCVILEKRDHVGGNCASGIDPETGIEVHLYGSHIFHTSNAAVWEYINKFTKFNDYQHHVEIKVGNQIYPMPISLATMNAFLHKAFTPQEAREFVRSEQTHEKADNLEDKAISLIGKTLYDAFIRGYTCKQWGCDPREMSPDIITRLPVRYNYNTRYFADTYEGIPLDGYDQLFKTMLDNPLIEVRLNCDFMDIRDQLPESSLIIYTGPIDHYFNYSEGRLGYRYVRFNRKSFDCPDFQGNSVINYGDISVPYTRIHEFRHYHPERPYGNRTVIYEEYSGDGSEKGEMAYPINTETNRQIFSRYQEKAKLEKNVIFGGRLASYKYWDMDDTIEASLKCFEEQVKNKVLE